MLFFFAFTLFVSATLLFLVQPMVGKLILPKLGGTPAVWNTCMVFFQAVLLVGYGYTHSLSTWHDRRRQLFVQFGILALPFLVLPFGLGVWNPPAEYNPVLSVLWLLLGMVGLPFFVVATTAPLLQKWFASTGHPAGKDPYFLYGASNLGSMLALLLYPVLIEPWFGLDSQAVLWTVGYGFFVLLVIGCGLVVWKAAAPLAPVRGPATSAEPMPAPAVPPAAGATSIVAAKKAGRHRPVPRTPSGSVFGSLGASDESLTWGRRLRWVGLAAAPSSLMLGVTTYITTDIAAIPFLWIIPLALYLLTFILVFARWPVRWTDVPHTVMLYLQPCFLMFLVLVLVTHLTIPTRFNLLLHLLAFFSTALVCHGELAKDRPAARHLTEFYLWMSVGGVLGGMFNALIAPPLLWFDVVEYYLAMVLACILRPALLGPTPLIPGDTSEKGPTPLGRVLDLFIPIGLGILAYFLAKYGARHALRSYALAGGVVIVLALAGRPIRFGLAVGLFIAGVGLFDQSRVTTVFQGRSFFGFVKVRLDDNSPGPRYHTLIHGGINHGSQHLEPHHRRLPITYFHPTGGIGQIFQKFSWPDARLPASLVGLGSAPGPFAGGLIVGSQSEPPYAVVGLGIGTLAAHARPFQHMIFYEIDPLIKRLSLPPGGEDAYFFYLQDALDRGANLEVVLGDGRLTLEKDPYLSQSPARRFDNYFHILVLDAFSSDAIPVHLLTAEAIDLYLSKLADGGVLIFNTTNRYVDIRPVLADLAEAKGLTCLHYGDESEGVFDKYGSDWVVMQRKEFAGTQAAANGGPPLSRRLDERWRPPQGLGGPVWTDKYSNLLRVLLW